MENFLDISEEEINRLYENKTLQILVSSIAQNNQRFNQLPKDIQYLSVALSNEKNKGLFSNLSRLFYKRPIPTIEEFLATSKELGGKNPYIGEISDNIFPQWKNLLYEVFAPGSIITEVIFSGAIGTGKSTASAIAHFYNLYRINSLKHPQKSMGTLPTKPMNLQLMTVTLKKAKSTMMTPILNLLQTSEHYQEVRNAREFLDFKEGNPVVPYYESKEDKTIYFPNNIRVTQGSQDHHAVGEDLFGAAMDEVEFRIGGNAEKVFNLYASLQERVRSRFMGNKFLLMTMISSIQHETGIISQHIKNRSNVPSTKIAQYSIWDVKYPNLIDEIGHFYVLRGTKTHPSRILTEEEKIEADNGTFKKPPGCGLIKVPNKEEYRLDFQTNIERALMNLAGVATIRDERPFDDLTEVIDKNLIGFFDITAKLKATKPLLEQVPKELFVKTPNGLSLARYPTALRYCHCDLASSGAAGISLVHKELSSNGDILYVVDFFCRITSPDKIDFGLVDNFLIDLKEICNIKIKTLTADQYQSVSTLQTMDKNNIAENVKKLSVDKDTIPYNTLSNVISQDCLRIGELGELENELNRIYFDKGKPYADKGDRKDIADSLCGSVFNAVQEASDFPIHIYENYNISSKGIKIPKGYVKK